MLLKVSIELKNSSHGINVYYDFKRPLMLVIMSLVLSNRAQKMIQEPLHLLGIDVGDGLFRRTISWKLSFSGDYSDPKKLIFLSLGYTLSDSCSSRISPIIIAETLSRLVIKKNLNYLHSLNFREIENYLRDSNERVSIPLDLWEDSKAFFEDFKATLVANVLIEIFSLANNLAKNSKNWEDLSLFDKNMMVKSIIDHFNDLFLDSKKIQLIYVQNNSIFIKNDDKIDLSVIQNLLNIIFSSGTNNHSLNLVADS